MSARFMFAAWVALAVLAASPARSQLDEATRPRLLPATHNGAFQHRHPEASALLDALWERRMEMFARLVRDGGAPSDVLSTALGSGPPERGESPAGADLPPAARTQLEWARALQRQIYDVYADDRVRDPAGAVGHLVDHFLGQTGVPLPSTPKSLAILFPQVHAVHEGHPALTFGAIHPTPSGLLYAQHWLELALFEPLMRFASEEERREGVRSVVSRYQEMVRAAPDGLPAAMPTTPAIAPDLSRLHPRAATVLDNVHMLQVAIAGVLANEHVGDKPAAIAQVIGRFLDPAELAVSEYDWMLMALRQGIYEQGGPAIGKLERSERNNIGGHAGHGIVLPGMRGLPQRAPGRPTPGGHKHQPQPVR